MLGMAARSRSNVRFWLAVPALLFGLAAWGLLKPAGCRRLRQIPDFSQPRPDAWWQGGHRTLALEVAAAAKAGQGWDVLFYGDSLIESLRGTRHGGGQCARCVGVAEVFRRHAGEGVHALGIGGDETSHLMWRLMHGELPRAYPPKLVLLLIGTNDLGVAARGGKPAMLQAAQATTERIEHIVAYLQAELEGAQIALIALLPRGSLKSKTRHKQPSTFSRAIAQVNEHFRVMAATRERLHFVECDDQLLLREDGSIDLALMPDALHPSAAGYEKLFSQCWDAAIARLLALSSPQKSGSQAR